MSQLSPSLANAKLAAFLSVRNGVKAVEFYKAAFGATELFRFDAGTEPLWRSLRLASPISG